MSKSNTNHISEHSLLFLPIQISMALAAQQAQQMTCIKTLVDQSSHLNATLPSNYIHPITPDDSISNSELEQLIPTIDFSALTSTDPAQRSKAIHDLSKACQDWGFFLVINHGVSESLMKDVMDACYKFFNLTDEEKKLYEGTDVLDPIRCGTSFNTSKEKIFFWRDFLKVLVHPDFHFPDKPKGFSELAIEYVKRIREVAGELLRGISISLGLEASYIHNFLDLESSLQVFVANLYPPCPQPELALGMPPHSDHGLLNILIENGVGGLQLQHNGKWVNVNAPPNSFLVNTCDHLEILSNGRYKSVVHRAVVNNATTRISLAMANGPSLDTMVSPAPALTDENNPPAYTPMKYKEYLQLQQGNKLDQKSILDRIRIQKE